MKVSLNSIRGMNRRYGCADDVTKIGVEALVEKIGAQLGGVDEVLPIGKKYNGIVIARVVRCEPHPNADRLKVCSIDDGGITPGVKRDENGLVQVVCAAPNARADITVAWLPPGSTVPETANNAEPFVLDARELRGVVSNGMLGSARELAIGDYHDGILEIDGDHRPGSDFAETFELKDDVVLDIENKMFTHRPDCFGFLGISRELAGIQEMPFKSPDWYQLQPVFPKPGETQLPLTVRNELPDLVTRFTAITMSNIQVGQSPVWLQVELSKVGLRSINNIVDYTNFFMLETGQPLHAYDYDKVRALSDGDQATIVVRQPHVDEKVKLLNGKTIDPRQEAILIATDKQAIGIGGVMGGAETEVDDTTTNIIIECANFDMYSVRRTSMAHGLFTDAVTRFNKGQSPLQNQAVLAKIVDEIQQFAGGNVAGPLIDDVRLPQDTLQRGSLFRPITVTEQFINDRLGTGLTAGVIKTLLQNVEFHVEIQGDDITVAAPFWRTDIELREDIVEEVGRLYGYDKLPLKLPGRDLTPTDKDPLFELKATIRDRLSKAGANELLTYSFVHGDLLQKVGQKTDQAFRLSNALSPDLQYYRLSLTPSLLEKVHPNVKAGYDSFALFEIGKGHILEHVDEAGIPHEFDRLALVYTGDDKQADNSGAAFYKARAYVVALFADDEASRLTFEPLPADDADSANPYYDPARAALIVLDGQVIGRIGEYRQSVRKALKLPAHTAGFELGLKQLINKLGAFTYAPLSRYPSVKQDMTLKVATDLSYAELYDCLSQAYGANAPVGSQTRLEPLDIYQADDSDHKNITFRFTTTATERTMTDQEVASLLTIIADKAKAAYGAERL